MKYQHRVLGMLSLLSIITYIDRVCIAVAGPRMRDALNISPQAWGWVTSVFFLSYNVPLIPMVVTLSLGAWLWLKVDPAHQLFEEKTPLLADEAELAVS